jgi:hypothetical protein
MTAGIEKQWDDMEKQMPANLDDFKVDHLILLVGGNPLPNYVAARVLAKSGATLHLVVTPKVDSVARRLTETLALPAEAPSLGSEFSAPQFIQVNEGDPNDIYGKVHELAKSPELRGRIGLNYTGGNRPMSVHAYDAVEDARSDAKFSYLDASRLALILHDTHRTTRAVRVDGLMNMRLDTLFSLHGMKEKKSLPASDTPIQPQLAAVLAELHATDAGAKTWFDWGGRKRDNKSANWTKLPKGEPGLEKVEAALKAMCADQEPMPECVAQAFGYSELPSCTKWFQGGWLESYVLAELKQAIAGRPDAQDALTGIHRIRDGRNEQNDFDLDVVVMRSYQLFTFSCIASRQKGECKEHLMETYVRARQMGGDEARIGLVCIYPDAPQLQDEIVGDLDAAGKIRVFGQKDLTSLKEKFSDWLSTQP